MCHLTVTLLSIHHAVGYWETEITNKKPELQKAKLEDHLARQIFTNHGLQPPQAFWRRTEFRVILTVCALRVDFHVLV